MYKIHIQRKNKGRFLSLHFMNVRPNVTTMPNRWMVAHINGAQRWLPLGSFHKECGTLPHSDYVNPPNVNLHCSSPICTTVHTGNSSPCNYYTFLQSFGDRRIDVYGNLVWVVETFHGVLDPKIVEVEDPFIIHTRFDFDQKPTRVLCTLERKGGCVQSLCASPCCTGHTVFEQGFWGCAYFRTSATDKCAEYKIDYDYKSQMVRK